MIGRSKTPPAWPFWLLGLALWLLGAGCTLADIREDLRDPEVRTAMQLAAKEAADVALGGGPRDIVEAIGGFVALAAAIAAARSRAQKDAQKIAARAAQEAKAQVHAERDDARRRRHEVTGDQLARPGAVQPVAQSQEVA